MPLDISNNRRNYHFALSDPKTLREKVGLDPWQYPAEISYVTYMDFNKPFLKEKGFQLYRRSSQNALCHALFMEIYTTDNRWGTQSSITLHYEYNNLVTQKISAPDNPGSDMETIFNMIRNTSMTGMFNDNMMATKAPIGNNYRHTGHHMPIIETLSHAKNAIAYLGISVNQTDIDPKLQIITFNSPEPKAPDTMIDDNERADYVAQAEEVNLILLEDFMDNLYQRNIIEPITEMPGIYAERALKQCLS